LCQPCLTRPSTCVPFLQLPKQQFSFMYLLTSLSTSAKYFLSTRCPDFSRCSLVVRSISQNFKNRSFLCTSRHLPTCFLKMLRSLLGVKRCSLSRFKIGADTCIIYRAYPLIWFIHRSVLLSYDPSDRLGSSAPDDALEERALQRAYELNARN